MRRLDVFYRFFAGFPNAFSTNPPALRTTGVRLSYLNVCGCVLGMIINRFGDADMRTSTCRPSRPYTDNARQFMRRVYLLRARAECFVRGFFVFLLFNNNIHTIIYIYSYECECTIRKHRILYVYTYSYYTRISGVAVYGGGDTSVILDRERPPRCRSTRCTYIIILLYDTHATRTYR